MKDRPGYFETLRIIEEMNLLQIALFVSNLCMYLLKKIGDAETVENRCIAYRAEFVTAMLDRFVIHGKERRLDHDSAMIALQSIIEHLFTVRDFVAENDWREFVDFFAASFTAYVKDPKPGKPYEPGHVFPDGYAEEYKAKGAI